MQKEIKPRSFTANYSGIARVLNTSVKISEAFDPRQPELEFPPLKEYMAIWDTGATNSVISERVINDLNLKSIGVTKVHTASKTEESDVFLINIMLLNNVGIPWLKVIKGYLVNADVLVGMDVICRGDFAITHLGDKTTFSFRFPSIECIDFVKNKLNPAKNNQTQPPPHSKISRNAPCPCGSGKKYKKCCGK